MSLLLVISPCVRRCFGFSICAAFGIVENAFGHIFFTHTPFHMWLTQASFSTPCFAYVFAEIPLFRLEKEMPLKRMACSRLGHLIHALNVTHRREMSKWYRQNNTWHTYNMACSIKMKLVDTIFLSGFVCTSCNGTFDLFFYHFQWIDVLTLSKLAVLNRLLLWFGPFSVPLSEIEQHIYQLSSRNVCRIYGACVCL